MTVFPYVTHTNWKQYNLVFISDDTLEGDIKVYDVKAIKAKRQQEVDKKTKKKKKRFTTTPYMQEITQFRKVEEGATPPLASGDTTIDLDKSIGDLKPKWPGFGYPMMNFHENPYEKTVMVNSMNDLEMAEWEMKDYEQKRHDIAWKKLQATSYEMIDNYYEHLRMLNAFEIIAKSFTHGAKLKRNPMSDEERARLRALEEEEQARFDVYKRAWDFKGGKAQSVGGYTVGDKTPFVLDWDEMIKRKAIKNSTAGRRAAARSRNASVARESSQTSAYDASSRRASTITPSRSRAGHHAQVKSPKMKGSALSIRQHSLMSAEPVERELKNGLSSGDLSLAETPDVNLLQTVYVEPSHIVDPL